MNVNSILQFFKTGELPKVNHLTREGCDNNWSFFTFISISNKHRRSRHVNNARM